MIITIINLIHEELLLYIYFLILFFDFFGIYTFLKVKATFFLSFMTGI